MKVNNAIYETLGGTWWDDDSSFELASLRYCVNPARYAYFQHVLREHGVSAGSVLDVGCGGGFLSESFAHDGFAVSSIDPSAKSIAAARTHADRTGLQIDYRVGCGEDLPFASRAFDMVACCDVLEHVADLSAVIREVARVLKPGGLFFYDTINRTRRSKLVLIKIWQDWGLIGLKEPNVHVWEKFIKPKELAAILDGNGFTDVRMTGLAPTRNPLAAMWAIIRMRRGRLHGEALGVALPFGETTDLSMSYMGYAVRADVNSAGA